MKFPKHVIFNSLLVRGLIHCESDEFNQQRLAYTLSSNYAVQSLMEFETLPLQKAARHCHADETRISFPNFKIGSVWMDSDIRIAETLSQPLKVDFVQFEIRKMFTYALS